MVASIVIFTSCTDSLMVIERSLRQTGVLQGFPE